MALRGGLLDTAYSLLLRFGVLALTIESLLLLEYCR